MPDPIIAAARHYLRQSLGEVRGAVDGLPAAALNWRPDAEGTNSFAVLATHVLHSTRSWLSVAMGAPLPERDRDSEFRASAGDPKELLAFVDRMSKDCEALLSTEEPQDWAAIRKTHARPGDTPESVPAGFALLHGLEHLREHVAHLQLTRQLWDAQR